MVKAGEQARKSFKQLRQKQFACAEDAKKALKQWRAKQSVCDAKADIIKIAVYSNKGRLKLERIEYQIRGE